MTESLSIVSETGRSSCMSFLTKLSGEVTINKWQITKFFSYFLGSLSFEKGGNKFHAINGDYTSTRPTLIGLKETLCNGMARELFSSVTLRRRMNDTYIHFIGFHWKSYTAGWGISERWWHDKFLRNIINNFQSFIRLFSSVLKIIS